MTKMANETSINEDNPSPETLRLRELRSNMDWLNNQIVSQEEKFNQGKEIHDCIFCVFDFKEHSTEEHEVSAKALAIDETQAFSDSLFHCQEMLTSIKCYMSSVEERLAQPIYLKQLVQSEFLFQRAKIMSKASNVLIVKTVKDLIQFEKENFTC